MPNCLDNCFCDRFRALRRATRLRPSWVAVVMTSIEHIGYVDIRILSLLPINARYRLYRSRSQKPITSRRLSGRASSKFSRRKLVWDAAVFDCNRHAFRTVATQAVEHTGILENVGAQRISLDCAASRSKCRWILPVAVFDNAARTRRREDICTALSPASGILQLLCEGHARNEAVVEHYKRLDDLSARFIRCANDCTLFDGRMTGECGLDFGSGDVVAARDDHVVGARLKPEVPVLVHT